MMNLLKKKSINPVALGILVLLSGMTYWIFMKQGYATGYGFSRATLATDMAKGYIADGGEWGFGRIVLPAIAILAWMTRERYRGLTVKPDHVIGGLLLLLGFFIYFAGYKANQKYFGFASGQIIAVGSIFWFLGRQWFYKSFWLVILLGMMWPWRFLIEPVSFPLQLVMVKVTSGFINLIGDGAVVNGTSIITAKLDPISGEPIGLNIAAACSGLRSLFALFMMGLSYGYLTLKSFWKHLVLIALVPLIAVLGNFIRMLMLYFGAQLMGSEKAIGHGEHDPSSYHIGSGLVVFVVALVVMIISVELLNNGFRIFKKRKTVVKKVQ